MNAVKTANPRLEGDATLKDTMACGAVIAAMLLTMACGAFVVDAQDGAGARYAQAGMEAQDD